MVLRNLESIGDGISNKSIVASGMVQVSLKNDIN